GVGKASGGGGHRGSMTNLPGSVNGSNQYGWKQFKSDVKSGYDSVTSLGQGGDSGKTTPDAGSTKQHDPDYTPPNWKPPEYTPPKKGDNGKGSNGSQVGDDPDVGSAQNKGPVGRINKNRGPHVGGDDPNKGRTGALNGTSGANQGRAYHVPDRGGDPSPLTQKSKSEKLDSGKLQRYNIDPGPKGSGG
ncbi:MAG: hypothetical protein ACRETW_05960, partial [Stenotrophobium sp.]